MDELFQQLLEADILTEETKSKIQNAYETQLNEAIAEAKTNASNEVRAELTEQWITERDALIEAIDNQMGEFLQAELVELKEDISRFRDLEAEYAEKLIEAKAEMATAVEADFEELVEKVDTFLEIRLNVELEELKEDIQDVKKMEFGRKLFEGFVDEYRKSFIDEDSIEAELHEARQQIAKMASKLNEAEGKLDSQVRNHKLSQLLEPLSGKQREVMEAILAKVPTANLEEGYKTFIGRVIKSTVIEETEEKEDKVLAESSKADEKTQNRVPRAVRVKTGDTSSTLNESHDDDDSSKQYLRELQRLAGVID